jgi:cell division protein FtsX
MFQLTGIIAGLPSALVSIVHAGPVLYALVLLALLVTPSSGERFADRFTFARVIATMHLSWGAGFVRGFLLGARGAVDTSRTES